MEPVSKSHPMHEPTNAHLGLRVLAANPRHDLRPPLGRHRVDHFMCLPLGRASVTKRHQREKNSKSRRAFPWRSDLAYPGFVGAIQ